jgi:hypothetical protein
MKALVEFYDDTGRCFESFRTTDEVEAIRMTALRVVKWRGIGFRNASCYVDGQQQWNLEINT